MAAKRDRKRGVCIRLLLAAMLPLCAGKAAAGPPALCFRYEGPPGKPMSAFCLITKEYRSKADLPKNMEFDVTLGIPFDCASGFYCESGFDYAKKVCPKRRLHRPDPAPDVQTSPHDYLQRQLRPNRDIRFRLTVFSRARNLCEEEKKRPAHKTDNLCRSMGCLRDTETTMPLQEMDAAEIVRLAERAWAKKIKSQAEEEAEKVKEYRVYTLYYTGWEKPAYLPMAEAEALLREIIGEIERKGETPIRPITDAEQQLTGIIAWNRKHAAKP